MAGESGFGNGGTGVFELFFDGSSNANFSFREAEVPEPDSLLLLGSGLAALPHGRRLARSKGST